MREIKFRAWDKERKKMLSAFEVVKGVLYRNASFALNSINNIFEVMQYTGLKDKNGKGKEMYESDILNGNREIFWHKIYNGFYIQDIRTCYPLSAEIKGLEVIGNIYENPELLKKVK